MNGPNTPRIWPVMTSKVAIALLISLATLKLQTALADEPDTRPNNQFDAHHPQIRTVIDVQEWHNEHLMALHGVVGTGIGIGADGNPVIKIFTERTSVQNLPDNLSGIPVKVEFTGMIVALASHEADTTAHFTRPVPIGVSTGHPAITAGTIGARVTDNAGRLYALSNNHVYADGNRADIGDQLLQPGSYDGGTLPADIIGTLYDYVPIDFSGGKNVVDAAIALTEANQLGTGTLSNGYGSPNSMITQASLGQDVQKCGRTTGCTRGSIDGINVSVRVCYASDSGSCNFAYFEDQISISPGTFSAGGDSGSLIVTDDTSRNPVALLFAGSSTRTFANPIDAVLSSFNVSIDGSTGAGSPTAPGDEAPTNIVLSATGYKVKGRHNVDLEWSGAGGSSVKVWRDEALIGTVDNNGIYTDGTDNRGGGSYSYQICEADSSNCSDVVTVAF